MQQGQYGAAASKSSAPLGWIMFAFTGWMVAAYLGFQLYGPDAPSPSPAAELVETAPAEPVKSPEEIQEGQAYAACKAQVEGRLKAPTQAEWPDPSGATIVRVEGDAGLVYDVRHEVFAPNAMGTKLRTPWVCGVASVEVAKSDTGEPDGRRWIVLDLDIGS